MVITACDGTMTVEKRNYEIKRGYNGSGKPVFFIYWEKTKTQRLEIEGDSFPFRSEQEAIANAECQTRCGKRIY
jgi:hypothetical protein